MVSLRGCGCYQIQSDTHAVTPFSHDLLGGVIPGNTSASGRGPQRCRFAVIVDSGQSSIIKCSVGDVLYTGEKVMNSTTKVILAGMALTSLGLTLSGPVPARTLVAHPETPGGVWSVREIGNSAFPYIASRRAP